MAEKSDIATIVGVAGAGFRLSLLLNAVGVEMMTVNREIQAIAKEISLSSLMLKQVGLAVTTAGISASRRALETAKGIAMQNQTIFTEIKDMAEMSQQRDENGHIRSITIASNAQSWFRKQRVQYLLGQLISLKLSLSIMLQILQLGKNIAEVRRDASKKPPTQQEMLQERAEIQNMVVVRNWSLVDLQRLYLLAEDEIEHPHDSPSPENREMQQVRRDPRLCITTAAHEENASNAMVKYHETPLSQLEASWDKAMYRPNRLLNAPDNNIVDLLLREWTQLYEMDSKARSVNGYQAHVDSDSDDSGSNSEFERVNTRGQYLKAAPRGSGVVKEVRFQAWVEDDMDSDEARPRRKGLKRGILRSGSDDSSSSGSDSEDLRSSRRSSTSSTTSPRTSISSSSGGVRRQNPAGVYGAPGPSGPPRNTGPSGPPRNTGPPRATGPPGSTGNTGMPPGAQPGMPTYPRSGPPSPRMSRPVSVPIQPRTQVSFDQQSQQKSARLQAPSVGSPHPSVSRNPYQPLPTASGPGRPGYGGYNAQSRTNNFPPNNFPPPPPPSQQQQQQQQLPPLNSHSFPPPSHRSSRSEPRHSKSRSQKRDRGESRKESSFKENAKKDVKRGLLGAGAVAGLMDILEGLSAI